MPDMPIHEIIPTRDETTTLSNIVAGFEAINQESDLHGPQLENECRTTTITIILIASPRLDILFRNRNPNETTATLRPFAIFTTRGYAPFHSNECLHDSSFHIRSLYVATYLTTNRVMRHPYVISSLELVYPDLSSNIFKMHLC